MEKNFEKLSIEEMSLVNGGDFCTFTCGVLGVAVTGGSGGFATAFGIIAGAGVGEVCTALACN